MHELKNIRFIEQFCRAVLFILFFPLAAVHKLLSIYETRKHQPEGRMVDIGTHKLHAIISGNEKPTVILEAGMGGCALDWTLVQPELSKLATVVSYDRTGYGWSDFRKDRATAEHYVEDLQKLIKELDVKPPYILVGHSFGGLPMRLFAAKYPNEVAGLVLVDSVHENWYIPEKMGVHRKKNNAKTLNMFAYILSPLGIQRLANIYVGAKNAPTAIRGLVKSLGMKTSAFKTIYLELLNAETSARQVQQTKLHDDIPITVISAEKQTEEWKKLQRELTTLNKQTKHVLAKDSWHSIQLYQPSIVIDSIKDMLEKKK